MVEYSYGQSDIDFNNLLIDKINIPDSTAKALGLKSKIVVKKIRYETAENVSSTYFDENGYVIKSVLYGMRFVPDSLVTVIDQLPDSVFMVTQRADVRTFGRGFEDLKPSTKEPVPVVLKSIYYFNQDSTIEIATYINEVKRDSIHTISYQKQMALWKLEKKEIEKTDTTYARDSLVVTSVDTTETGVRRFKKLYFHGRRKFLVKEEYLNFEKDSLVHHGITLDRYDKRARPIYHAEWINGMFSVIERTKYDRKGGKTISRMSNPAEGKKYPDYIYQYDGKGRVILSARYSNRTPLTYVNTNYYYSAEGLLLREEHFRNKRWQGITSYYYEYWK